MFLLHQMNLMYIFQNVRSVALGIRIVATGKEILAGMYGIYLQIAVLVICHLITEYLIILCCDSLLLIITLNLVKVNLACDRAEAFHLVHSVLKHPLLKHFEEFADTVILRILNGGHSVARQVFPFLIFLFRPSRGA